MDDVRCLNCDGRLDRPGLFRCEEPCHPTPDLAWRIVTAIERDLNNRRGLGFEGLDEDVQYEIRDRWVELIKAEFQDIRTGQ